jgi:hypothetical protein
MSIYNVVDISTGFFESIVTFMLFDNFMERRKKLPFWVYWLGIIALTISFNISNYIFKISILNIGFMILAKFLISFLYKGNIKVQLVLAVVSFAISSLLEVIVCLTISMIKQIDLDTAVNNANLRLLGIMLSKTLSFSVVKLICLFSKKKLAKIQTSYWILFITNFSIVVLTIYLIFSIQTTDINSPMGHLSIICSLGLLYGVFTTMYLYENMSKQSQILREKELSEQQFNTQIKHLNELVIAQKQARGIKHDLANHLISIKSYLCDNKVDECCDYVNNLINHADINSDIIDTGNSVVDAILTAKKNLAKSKKIEFISDIQIPEKLKIDSSDCCIIFGNALDNAIEACEKVQGYKYIKINLIYHENSLVCKVTNSSVNIKNPLLQTTKRNKKNHGIGFSNIRDTLEKYNHIMRVEQNDEEFMLFFILYDIN